MEYIIAAGSVLLIAFLMCSKLGRKSDPDWYDDDQLRLRDTV